MTKNTNSEAWSNAVIKPIYPVHQPYSNAASSPKVGNQKKSTPPLPPPPNLKLTRSQAQAESVVMPETTSQSSSPTPTNTPYEIHTEGPLTYFNYYFEDVVPSATADSHSPAAPSKVTVGLIGAGVVAVTVASGLIIGDALKQPDSETRKPANTVKRSPTNLPRPTTTSPEPLNTPRSTPQSTPQPTIKPRSSQTSNQTSIQSPLQPEYSSPTEAIAAPETIALNPSTPLTPSRPAPATTNRKLPAFANSNLSSVIVRQEAIKQSSASAIAPPETLEPTTAAPESVRPSSPTQATNDQAQPASTPAAITPETASNPTSIQAPTTADEATAPDRTTTPLPPNQDANDLRRFFPERTPVAMGDRAAPAAATNPSTDTKALTQTSTAAAKTQRIQDYLNLAQKANPNPIALMPLSQQAATEASNLPQVGPFAVRQVNPQDYQKEWVVSNKTVEDPAIALAFPAYGFIDYQRQLIVVLQPQLEPSAQSQKLAAPQS